MSNKAISLYLHVHQPYRIRHYTVFDAGTDHRYFEAPAEHWANNRNVIRKITEKSYLPTNAKLQALLERHREFCLSLSLSGTVIEQLEAWAPDALDSFKRLVDTGRVELLAETYHHSLAFFYSKSEFESQVAQHREKLKDVFGVRPQVFRNTELAYNNELAAWAEAAGYKAVLAEGWDAVLGWRSPNFVYRPPGTERIRLLLKNYKLSDDIAFRFSNREWEEWPLTAEKFAHWLQSIYPASLINLFMDYETFGEHQWADTGIFDFLDNLPSQWLQKPGNGFKTVSQAAEMEPVDVVDMPYTVTWADTERDLTAWLGNPMQQQAIIALYQLEQKIHQTNDPVLLEDWRKLQASDHFYYMCTKWFSDGDVHAYFSPYGTPYEAFINFINAYHDLKYRLTEHGVEV